MKDIADGAGAIKTVMEMVASAPDIGQVLSENRAVVEAGINAVVNIMKQVADMVAMAVLSGGAAAMMVAAKYYVAKMVESMTSVGYADDP